MDTYRIGNDQQHIRLALDVNTIGLAASRAIVIQTNPHSQVPVAHSMNATGDIFLTGIGTSATLQNKRLSIFTQVNLWGNDNQRRDQYNNISTIYSLEGGSEGQKTFNSPMINVDQNYNVVFILKYIDLI